MACLTESVVLALVRGSLEPRQRALADQHIDVCPECSELVALCAGRKSLAAPSTSPQPPSADTNETLAPDPDLLLGGAPVDGRFVVCALAGEGAMGRVYHAEDLRSGELVALKVLHEGPATDEARFEREACILASLSHAHVVRYVAHGCAAGRRYLVMQWLEGHDLRTRLARERLTTDEAVSVVLRAAQGLAAVHAAGLLHRDVKPSNLFLEKGDIDRVKLIDFGLARSIDLSTGWTRTGDVLGTLGYMAPEQARGERGIDARVDVFALGRVLFECLTGKPAFMWKSGARRPRVRELAPEIPESLEALVERMSAERPELRPANAAEVVEALERAMPATLRETARASSREQQRTKPSLPPAETGGVRTERAVLVPGAVLGRYRVEEMLGEGGMGQVYRAHDTLLRRDVALKLLRPRGGGSRPMGEMATRLLREARAAAALNHPNVVSIFDVGDFDGTPFIAMELAIGKPLRAYVGDAGVPLSRKIRWLVEVARALDAAHASGLVHRDVKPENVLVCSNDVAKVLDFGVAKRLGGTERTALTEGPEGPQTLGSPTLGTRDGRLRGTPRYMSPEQLFDGSVDARSDQYAWGVVAYELLASVHPMHTSAPSGAGPMPLDEHVPELPKGIAALVMRALHPEASERFPSMGTIVESLEACVLDAASMRPEPMTIAAAPEGDPAVTTQRAPRSRRQVRAPHFAFAALALLFVGAAAALFAGVGPGPRHETTPVAAAAKTPAPEPSPAPTSSATTAAPEVQAPVALEKPAPPTDPPKRPSSVGVRAEPRAPNGSSALGNPVRPAGVPRLVVTAPKAPRADDDTPADRN